MSEADRKARDRVKHAGQMFPDIAWADQQAADMAIVEIEALIQMNFPCLIFRIVMVHGPAFQLGSATDPFKVEGFAHMDAELQMLRHTPTFTPKPSLRPT